MLELKGQYNTAKIFTNEIDSSTEGQLLALLNQGSMEETVIRVMPDCHAGRASVIGTTMTITDKVVPNIVGVDIGCGVLVVKLKEKRLDLPKLDSFIKNNVPSGFAIREKEHKNTQDIDLSQLKVKSFDSERAYLSIGTLGGGNHFIEIDKDEEENLYLIIHSGSRNLGTKVAEYYQDLAFSRLHQDPLKETIRGMIADMKEHGKDREIEQKIKDMRAEVPVIPKELSYLEGEDFQDYIHDMEIAQTYATINRRTMADVILKGMKLHEIESFETVHNYIDMRREHYEGKYMLRKGAISALEGEMVIIPINMRDGCILAKGKSAVDYNKSAPHGAGRVMSRAQAKNELQLSKFKESMKGVFSTTVSKDTLDESPMAYKTLDLILPHITETVDIVAQMKPIYNFKAEDVAISYKKKK